MIGIKINTDTIVIVILYTLDIVLGWWSKLSLSEKIISDIMTPDKLTNEILVLWMCLKVLNTSPWKYDFQNTYIKWN